MNTSNSTTYCTGYESYQKAGEVIAITSNYIIGPICFILGVVGHSISIRVYSRQIRQGYPAFRYQIFNSAVQMCCLCDSVIFMLVYHFWSGIYTNYVDWFVTCEPCMWYAAHLVTVTGNSLITLCVMLSVCTAADRVFALSHPFAYKNIDHRKHQTIAFIICAIIAISTGLFDTNRSYVESTGIGAKFKIVYNVEYMQGLGAILIQVTTVVRVCLALLLIGLDASTVYFYRIRFSAQTKLVFKDKAEAKRKQSERTLTLLCICQSIFASWDITTGLIAYMMFYVAPEAYTCGDVAAYCLYLSTWFVRCFDFYVMLGISRQFRVMVIKAVPILGRVLRVGGGDWRVAAADQQTASVVGGAERATAGQQVNNNGEEVII